jgi:glycosyltransferase XagB
MVLAPLFYLPLAAMTLRSLLDGSLLRPATGWEIVNSASALVVLVTGSLAAVVPVVLAMKDRRATGHLAAIVLLPLYYVFVSAAAWVALKDLIFRPFQWNKTEHGQALMLTSPGTSGRPDGVHSSSRNFSPRAAVARHGAASVAR